MKNKNNKFIKYLIPINILLIIIIIIYGINTFFNKKTTSDILIDKTKDVVYTYYEDNTKNKLVPALNIINLSDTVNNDINNFVNPYLNKEYNKISYHYQINGNILSLFLSIEDYEIEGLTDVHFLSFIIDLKKLKVLNNKEVLDMFNVNEEQVTKTLDNDFKGYYKDEKNKTIIPSNETYETYLKNHEINNFIDQVYYDIDKGELNIYLDYNIWSQNESEAYLADIGYVFVID